MTPTINQKIAKKPIGLVNHYAEIWACRSHTLLLLTNIISVNVNFKCTGAEQDFRSINNCYK